MYATDIKIVPPEILGKEGAKVYGALRILLACKTSQQGIRD
jgi:hypothetical protein